MVKHVLYLIIFCPLLSFGQSNTYRFDHLTTQFEIVEDGLSGNTVLCLFQDSRGFLWVGTYSGLNRYDGYKVKAYKFDDSKESTISNDMIRGICEDNEGNLWVGTNSGLNKFVRDTERFTRFLNRDDDPSSISNNQVNAVCKDLKGDIWAATENGLNMYDMKNKKFIRYMGDHDEPSGLKNSKLYSLYQDKDGYMWIGGNSWLNKFDPAKKEFSSVFLDPSLEAGDAGSAVSICEDHNGLLWIVMFQGGIASYDKSNGGLIYYLNDPLDNTSISSNSLRVVFEDSQNRLWIGSYDSGLNLFDRDKKKFTRISKSYRRDGLNDNGVYSILEDRSGILWFGTWAGGLNKYGQKYKFKTFSHNPEDQNSLGSNEVYAVYVDQYNELWVGTETTGLDRIDRDRTKITHYSHSSSNLNSISSNAVYTICEDKSGYIWVGTGGRGVNRFERSTGKFTCFKHIQGDLYSLGNDIVSQMRCDSKGNIWIGMEEGIDKYIQGEDKFVHYTHKDNDPGSLDKHLIYSLYVDRMDNIWAGTNGGGIYKYDRQIDDFRKYTPFPTGNSVNAVSVIFQDKNGSYWAGTNGGIIKFEPQKKLFRLYSEVDGLISNTVNGILEDNNGNLWISTGKGLSRFDPVVESFTSYDASSGLQGTEFNTWAYFKNTAGRMYFGGTNGLTSFDPSEIKDNQHIPDMIISDINVLHTNIAIGYDSIFGRIILEKSISETKQIELNYDENIISFEILALDFKNPRGNKYAFILEGFDKEWTYKDASQRYITYTNLNPGKYVFRIRGSNSDGVWNEVGTSLTLIVRHPWWGSWWAYSLYLILFITAFAGSSRFYLNRKALKNQLKLEHEHASKLAEVDRIKSNFFTNVSHEFRTPLTLIMGPSDNIIKSSSGEEIKKEAETIRRNAGRLLRLINQLLDLSKLDEKKLKLHAAEANIISFIKGIVMSFEAFAERKDLTLSIQASKNNISLYFDRDKMEHIITNLLSNAIKFTSKGGYITVKIIEKDEDTLLIKIKDTGIGISESEIPKLFDRFYQVDSSQTREYEGSGLGLSLTKELVELHHGTISVESKVGNPKTGKAGWTEFTIELPRGEYHLTEDEILKKPETIEIHDLPEPEVIENPVSVQEETQKAEENNNDKTIILIVEDNKDVREYIREILNNDYCVEEAINGEQGVRKAERIIPDLIVSDIMMPKMDGNQLTRILKNEEKTSHIPIILLTAKCEQESRIEGLETGADDYLTKPFDTEELRIRIKNLIENRRKLQEKFRRGGPAPFREVKHFGRLDQNFIDKLNKIIDEHLSEEEFSIEDLGKGVNMSRSQVHRKLTALTGKSPSLYMRSLRLAKASELIRAQTGNISEIAYSVGFSSPAYFTRCFKEEFGFPPSDMVNHIVK